jgi:hypothetical protein
MLPHLSFHTNFAEGFVVFASAMVEANFSLAGCHVDVLFVLVVFFLDGFVLAGAKSVEFLFVVLFVVRMFFCGAGCEVRAGCEVLEQRVAFLEVVVKVVGVAVGIAEQVVSAHGR